MFDDDENDDENEIDNLSGNDLVKALRKQLSAATKQLKQQDNIIAELTTVKHEATIGQMLKSYGLDEGIATFIPDSVESEDDLDQWLGEYGKYFGIVEAGDESSIDEDDSAADYMNQFEDEEGIDPEVGHDLASRMQALKAGGTPDQLLALIGATAGG